jgi:hypothetical protein
MADNFEQLGFQVKVDGADSAVSNLDRIVERLERINQLQGKKISMLDGKRICIALCCILYAPIL